MKQFARLLTWIFLPLLSLVAASLFLLGTESGFRILTRFGDSLSGSVFSVEEVQGRFLSSWQLKQVQIHVDGIVHVELDELRCRWNPGALFVRELHVRSIKAEGLVVRLEERDEVTADTSPLLLPPVHLPLDLRLDELLVSGAAIFFPGSSDSYPVDELILQASAGDDHLHIARLKLKSPDYGGELQGDVQFSDAWPLQLRGQWRVTDPGIGDLSGSLTASGDLETLDISVGLKRPAVARVQGQLTNLLNDLRWNVSGETEHFTLGDLKVDLPMDGTLTVFEASGTLLTYGGTLAADIHYQGYPQIQARAAVQGDYDGLNIHSLQLFLDQATLTASGQVDWTDTFSWQAELVGEELDPGQFVSQWPGKIETSLRSQGQWRADSLAGDLTIDRLQGELRGFSLAGSGRVEIDGKTLSMDELHLQSGSSHLLLNGRANSELDLAFQAHSDDLASLLPESSGAFQLQGTVRGRREQPLLSMTFEASELTVGEYLLQSMEGVVNADLTEQGHIEAEIDGRGIQIQGEKISEARLQVKGNLENHHLDLSLSSSLGDLQCALAGGVQERQWQGELSRLLLQSDQFGEWRIKQAVPLRLAEKSCEISELCFFQDQVQLLFTGKWQRQGGWQIRGGVENFPLQLLEEWKLFSPKLDGILSATVLAGGEGLALDSAEVNVSVPDLALTAEDEEGESRTYHWTENSLQARLEKSDARITARTLFQDNSVAEFNAALGNCCDFSKPEEISLDGNLDLDINDLSPLAPLSRYAVTADGSLMGRYTLQGTLARPILKGKMSLQDGEIGISAAGIGVHDLQLQVDGDGSTNKIDLSMASGEGHIRVEGVVKQDLEKEWQADVTIQGKDFQGADLLEYTAVVSPDMHCVYGKDGLTLSGRVHVPQARIAPAGLQGAVSSSRDVILINGDDEQEQAALPVSLDLAVILGEEVAVDAFGLQGKLDGKLKINQKPGQAVTGLGNLNLHDGTFTFRGSTLEISRGLVFYQGGAIEDPGLDVRARKKVRDKVVGIQVTGSVSQMEMNLFSEPHMNDSDILAYLLVGHDMATSNDMESSLLAAAASALGGGTGGGALQEIGEGTGLNISLASGEETSDVSLVVGREIYNDLYISYGKGLTDSVGTFKARYNLKHGFSVETEVTDEETGTDLFWSLER